VGRRLSHAIRVVTTQFDARSRPVSVLDDSVNAIGVSNWGYDAVNRRVSASFTNGVASAFTYDLNNRLTSIQHASDVALLPSSADLFDFSFGYDVVGNLLYKKDHIRTDRSEAYAYDDLNRLTLMQRGVPNVADPTIIATPIDDARMPWTLDWTDAGGDPTLDQRGNWASVERTQRVGGNDTTESQARSLDAVGGAANEYYQIEHSGSPGPIEQLEYDEAGNLIAIYVMADMNCDGQVTSADIDGFTLAMTNPEQYAITYEDCLLALGDLNGDGYVTAADITLFTQMVTAAVGSDIAKRFTYDEENRLVSVSTLDDTLLHEYLYDALGRRILTHDHTVTPAVQTRHVYGAGFEPLAEYESSDNWETEDLAREFLWGERFPEPLVLIDWTTGPEKAYHYLHDHLGSVIALVDAGDPEAKPEPIPPKVVERYTYDPYGTTYIETWKAELPAGCTTPSECGCESDGAGGYWCESDKSAYGNPFAWTAQRYDAGVGLYAFPFRGYSPALGRFLQRDPLGYIDGPNLYEYARSMPTVLTDPLGLAAGVAGGISGGGGGGIGSGPGALGGAEPSAGQPGACGGVGLDPLYPLDPDRTVEDILRDWAEEIIRVRASMEYDDWPLLLRLMYEWALFTIRHNMSSWEQAYNAFMKMRQAWLDSLPSEPTSGTPVETEDEDAGDGKDDRGGIDTSSAEGVPWIKRLDPTAPKRGWGKATIRFQFEDGTRMMLLSSSFEEILNALDMWTLLYGSVTSMEISDHAWPGNQMIGREGLNLNDASKLKPYFAPNGRLILQGCYVAKGLAGQEYLHLLARETGVPVTGWTGYVWGFGLRPRPIYYPLYFAGKEITAQPAD
jgi:RHS repeat-associated protein